METTAEIIPLSDGATQRGVRDHNERLILSILQRNGPLPGSDIARQTKLSAQTVSVILRKLQSDDLVFKGKPVKGKVGKPSIPIGLNPEGALSLGFKLGRRNSEVVLTDLTGKILYEKHLTYDVALPRTIFDFIRQSFEQAIAAVGPKRASRLCGIGIAAPFEIWKWGASEAASQVEFQSWKDVSFEAELAKFTALPVFMVNDATSACWAEQVYGSGRRYQNFAYFYVSTFIGGGIVLNQSVFEGPLGNAGAFGPLRIRDQRGEPRQLLDVASIHTLEKRLLETGEDPRRLWQLPQDWTPFDAAVDDWVEETARALAEAIPTICAVIDFEAILIDGYIPQAVRAKLAASTRAYLPSEDWRGLITPRVEEGQLGSPARAIGAACVPIFAQYFLGARAANPERSAAFT